jgi:hypothetical protein
MDTDDRPEKENRMENEAFNEAEAHLKRAEADLNVAHEAEAAAEREIEVAVHEIREAEEHHRHEIHFEVDGEPCETTERELTPNRIIVEFGHKSPTDHYLVQIIAGHTDSYQGKGDVPIKMHSCMNFQIVCTGPATVSDGPIATGVEVFLDGLRGIGFDPKPLTGKPDHIVFDYQVPVGRFKEQAVKLGFVVPSDFPMSTPTGPYVSPRIHPSHPANDIGHPHGGIHDQQALPFIQATKADWQYWSRPCPNWGTRKKTVVAYMSHIYRLWETQ